MQYTHKDGRVAPSPAASIGAAKTVATRFGNADCGAPKARELALDTGRESISELAVGTPVVKTGNEGRGSTLSIPRGRNYDEERVCTHYDDRASAVCETRRDRHHHMKICPLCESEYTDTAEVCPVDGKRLFSLAERVDELVGNVFNGRYRLVEKIGEGGMGSVYRGVQEPVGRAVAVKVLQRELASDKTAVKRFFNEARVVSKLRHPNTVTLYDFGQSDTGHLFIAMEYLTGVALDLMIVQGDLGLAEIVEIMEQICQSLDEAHGLGIVHRDLKPDNIFIDAIGKNTKSNMVKVLDFGIAKVPDSAEHLTRTGMVFGTPAFMSPEQAQGFELDSRSDIYTLGIVLYQMLCGDPPFRSDSPMKVALAQVSEPPDNVVDMSMFSPLPKGLASLVMDMLEKEPERRPQTVAEVRERLLKVAKRIPELNVQAGGGHAVLVRRSDRDNTIPEAWKSGSKGSARAGESLQAARNQALERLGEQGLRSYSGNHTSVESDPDTGSSDTALECDDLDSGLPSNLTNDVADHGVYHDYSDPKQQITIHPNRPAHGTDGDIALIDMIAAFSARRRRRTSLMALGIAIAIGVSVGVIYAKVTELPEHLGQPSLLGATTAEVVQNVEEASDEVGPLAEDQRASTDTAALTPLTPETPTSTVTIRFDVTPEGAALSTTDGQLSGHAVELAVGATLEVEVSYDGYLSRTVELVGETDRVERVALAPIVETADERVADPLPDRGERRDREREREATEARVRRERREARRRRREREAAEEAAAQESEQPRGLMMPVTIPTNSD